MSLFVTDSDVQNFVIQGVNYKGGEYLGNYGYIVKMPKKSKLRIGFDQSTSQTGLAVKTVEDNRLIALFDFINLGGKIQNTTFSEMIVHTLAEMFAESQVETIVIEKPFQGKGARTHETLLMLKGVIRTLTVRVKGMRNAEIVEILPVTWRSEYLKDKRYTGKKKDRKKAKESAMQETGIRYPDTKMYIQGFTNPPDCCDAIGVLDGWIGKNFKGGDKSQVQVNKTMEIQYRTKYIARTSVIQNKNIFEMINRTKADWEVKERGYKLMHYNADLSYKENCLRAVSNTNEVCILVISSQEQNLVFMWETGYKLKEGELFVVVTWRENISKNLKLSPNPEHAKYLNLEMIR